MNYKEKQFLLDVARTAANRSSAIRSKVGAVVADSLGNIVATGYNGSVRGFHTNELETRVYPTDNTPHDQYPLTDMNGYPFRLVTNEDIVIHAECNVIAHAARRGISINGGTMFTTLSPCSKCTALMIQCGIQEVVYLDEYRLHSKTEELYGKYIRLTHWKP